MFLPFQFESLNHVGLLQAGNYHASRRAYVSPDLEAAMLWFEYRRPDDHLLCACDMILIDRQGAVRICDFLLMADRSWRDSLGARAESLMAFLPNEVGYFRLLDEARLGDLSVREQE